MSNIDYGKLTLEAIENGGTARHIDTNRCLHHEPMPSLTRGEPMPMPPSTLSWGSPCAPLPPVNLYTPPGWRHSRAHLSELIKKWPCALPKETKQKDKSEIAGSTPFSNDFLSLLGYENSTNIQKIDDEMVRRCIFSGLVEEEAYRQYRSARNIELQHVLGVVEKDFNLVTKDSEGSLAWTINWGEKTGRGFAPLFKVIFNISRWDAVATLAGILGMDSAKAFSVFDVTTAADEGGWNYKYDQVPKSFCIPTIPTGEAVAELKAFTPLYGHVGQTVGGVAIYRLGDMTFSLPVAVANGVLCVGQYKALAGLLNQEKIDNNPLATVFLCQDIRTAIALDKLVSDSRGLAEKEVVITGHIGHNLSVIPWNYLYGRNVVLLCAPEKDSLAMVKAYEKVVQDAGATSFKVYPYPLLHAKPGRLLDGSHMRLFDACEAELLKNTRELDLEERPSVLIRHILATLKTWPQYVTWGRELGLFKMESTQSDSMPSPIFRVRENINSLPQTASEATLTDIFALGTVSAIHGPKDAGKSLIIRDCIKGISSGQSVYGFKASMPEKCLLFDSETPSNVCQARYEAAGLPPEGNETFVPIVRLNLEPNHPWASFDLMNEVHRDQLADYTVKSNAKYLFIDNITSCSRPGTPYTQTGIGTMLSG